MNKARRVREWEDERGRGEKKKEQNSTTVNPILIYVAAENKQVIVLLICHRLHLSLSEGTRMLSSRRRKKNGNERDYAPGLMLKVTPLHYRWL